MYIVVENSEYQPPNGGVYSTTFNTFEEAKAAALANYKDVLDKEREEMGEDEQMTSEVDVPESTTGVTTLYIEKGINIYIHKLPLNTSGGRRVRGSKTRRTNRK